MLNEQIYIRWQSKWEASEVGSTTRMFLPSISDCSSCPLDLNFFVTEALTGHGCLCEYRCRFNFSHSPSCSCGAVSQYITHIFYSCPRFDVLRRVFNVSPNSPCLSSSFLKFAGLAMRCLWKEEQFLLPFHSHRRPWRW